MGNFVAVSQQSTTQSRAIQPIVVLISKRHGDSDFFIARCLNIYNLPCRFAALNRKAPTIPVAARITLPRFSNSAKLGYDIVVTLSQYAS